MSTFPFKVGDKIQIKSGLYGDYDKVVFVGETIAVFITSGNVEWFCFKNDRKWDRYELYEEPKKTVKMWPAIITPSSDRRSLFSDHHRHIGTALFKTIEEAKEFYADGFTSWPAIPNADGSYDIPVEE